MSEKPELGQIVGFAAGTGSYGTSDQVDALVMDLIHEIERVFWNREQREWDSSWSCEDPKIQGVTVRGFRYPKYDCFDDVPESEQEEAARDTAEAALPSFEHGEVAIWWYKYPGRSMSSNREMSAEGWFAWHASALAAIRSVERRS